MYITCANPATRTLFDPVTGTYVEFEPDEEHGRVARTTKDAGEALAERHESVDILEREDDADESHESDS